MYVDFTKTLQPQACADITLECCYRLIADESYHVRHQPVPQGSLILICVTAGEGFMRCCEKSFSLTAGNILLTSPSQKMFEYYTVGSLWSFWWFEFYCEPLPFETDIKRSIHINSFLGQLCERSFSLHKQGRLAAASGMMAGLLSAITQQMMVENSVDYRRVLVQKAELYIKENISSVTVAVLARAVGMNERALRSLFHEYTNNSPKEYIIAAKLNTACYMLQNTTKSIGEISELLGFSSQFHFSSVYKEYFGLSPSAYRAKEYWQTIFE